MSQEILTWAIDQMFLVLGGQILDGGRCPPYDTQFNRRVGTAHIIQPIACHIRQLSGADVP